MNLKLNASEWQTIADALRRSYEWVSTRDPLELEDEHEMKKIVAFGKKIKLEVK